MKITITPEQFLNSITGVSALGALSLLAARKFNLAAILFGALAAGSVGVAWDRYSTKSGSALDIRVIKKRRRPDDGELAFILTHAPYAFLAVLSYLLGQRLSKR